MLKRYALLALAMTLATATQAAAENAYDALSKGNQMIVDSLHFFQEAPDGSDSLTRGQLAALKADGGWGHVFKDLKNDGYFDEYKNLGALVSRWNHQRIGLHRNGPGASWKRTDRPAGAGLGRGRPGFQRPNRPQRISRVSRPSRPSRRR